MNTALAIMGGIAFGFFGNGFVHTGHGALLILAVDGLLAIIVATVL